MNTNYYTVLRQECKYSSLHGKNKEKQIEKKTKKKSTESYSESPSNRAL